MKKYSIVKNNVLFFTYDLVLLLLILQPQLKECKHSQGIGERRPVEGWGISRR